MADDLLWMEGCDGITTVAADSHELLTDRSWIVSPTGSTLNAGAPYVLAGGRGSGRCMEIRGSFSGNHNRGLRLNLQHENEDLWVGFWWKQMVGVHWRIFVLYVDGVAVWSLNYNLTGQDLFTDIPPNMDAVAPTDKSGASSEASFGTGDEGHLRVHVHREAAEGTVEVYLGGALVMSDTFAAVGLNEGALDVLFNGRNHQTSSQPSWTSRFDDLWVAESDYGDARIVTLRPTADGFHSDGTPSTGTDLYAILDQDLGDTTEHVTFAGGDKATFDMDTAPLDTLSALNAAAIQVDVYMTGPSALDAIHRLSGTDNTLVGLTQLGTAAAAARSEMLFTNPATGGSFLPSDFEGGEFGVEA